LFVTSHFTAHQSKIQERNNDFTRICRELKLRGNGSEVTDVTGRYDYTFWCGDLNYRINGTRKMVDELLRNDMIEVLQANDQLRIEMDKQRVFQGFIEPQIMFPPTYKFDFKKSKTVKRRRRASSSEVSIDAESDEERPVSQKQLEVVYENGQDLQEGGDSKTGSLSEELKRSRSIYDTSRKQRIPSWTDRILYKETRPNQVKIEKYDTYMEMMHSDHKPVYGVFTIKI
jgi:hypothetical protein